MKNLDTAKYQPIYLCALLVSGTSLAYAGSTSVTGIGAKGSAMQAFTAVADSPSAIYYNPAGLVQIPGSTVTGGINLIYPDLEYINDNNSISSSSTASTVGANAFYVNQLNSNWWFGLGLYAPYARYANYHVNSAVYNTDQSSLLLRQDLVPTITYKINSHLSLGVSAVASYVQSKSDSLGLDESGSGTGFTGQVGLLWKATNTIQVGIDYRAAETAHTTGNGTYQGQSGDYDADIDFPAVFSAGVAWAFHPQWLLSLEYDSEQWSTVETAQRNYDNPTLNAVGTNIIDGQDSNNYRVGLAYQPSDRHAYYLGYSYIQAAIPADNISPAQPDYNAEVYSIGYSYILPHWQYDFAYEYDHLLSRESNSAVFPGDYYGNNQQFFIDISYRWG